MKLMSINITVEIPDDIQPPDATVLVNKKVNKSPEKVGTAGKKYISKRWTRKEEKFLIDNHSEMTYEDMAEELGRTKSQIAVKLYELRNKGKIPRKLKKKGSGRLPKYLNPNDNGNSGNNGNGLTCADCPKAEKESNGTVFCTVDKVRMPADTPMCQDMVAVLEKVNEP